MIPDGRLEKLPTNDLLWHVLDFEGVGTAPDGMTVQAFDQAIDASPEGYSLSWGKRLTFASDIEQTWNCLIVGGELSAKIITKHIEARGFVGCRYVITVFDSTEWSVGIDRETAAIGSWHFAGRSDESV